MTGLSSMKGVDHFEAALAAYRANDGTGAYQEIVATLAAAPGHPKAWYWLGHLLHLSKKWRPAAAAFHRHLALSPKTADDRHHTLVNIGWNTHLAGDSAAGEGYLREAVKLDKGAALPWINLGQVLWEIGDSAGAEEAARLGFQLAAPEEHAAEMGLAFILLGQGRWAEGWRHFEARIPFKFPEFAKYPYPRWDGGAVDRLFIQAEQGLGDVVMAARWLAAAADRAKTVVLYAPPAALSLLRDLGIPNLLVDGLPRALPEADAFCPMFSLPLALGLSDGEIGKRRPPYIQPRWTAGVANFARVGINWAGSDAHDGDAWRSAPLEAFGRLAKNPRIRLCSFQFGPNAKDLTGQGWHGLVEDLSPRLGGLAETAVEMRGIDLMLSVDTSAAHLAGALGVPVALLLGDRRTDWRWGPARDGAESCWYAGMRVFRKGREESWVELAERAVVAMGVGETGLGEER